jgi:hypothetical protein
MRTRTQDLPPGSELPHDRLSGTRSSVSFFARLLGAWVAMGLRSPSITFVEGEVHV